MQFPEEDERILDLFDQGGSSIDQAFHLLVSTYGEILYAQIRRITRNHEQTNDVLQDVLVKVYQNLESFKRNSSLYTWMYRICRNETLNFIEKENRRTGVDLDPPMLEILAGNQTLDTLDSEKISSLLNQALELLPEKQALVFHLRYFEEMPYSEISKKLSTSEGGLKASFHHAKQKIQEFILNALNQ
ncbi:MAG: RNA polymerase subunit sigma [Bacteroidetes bacterium]|nr:MAG: RNA polymerase subunit sigma [Bacteroidota bacterium]